MARHKYHYPLKNVWRHMMSRCYDKNHNRYYRYGARGVAVCSRWHEYRLFCDDMLPTYEKGLQLDRIDNNGNYEPGNCRWATSKEQSRNKSTSAFVTHNGITKTVADWAEESPVKPSTFRQRLYVYKWDFADCFKPVGSK